MLWEDNQAPLQVLKTGKNPTMRHLGRTHRVNLAWLSEVFRDNKQVSVKYCQSADQAADILTKAFSNPHQWRHVCGLIGIVNGNSNNYGKNADKYNADKKKKSEVKNK